MALLQKYLISPINLIIELLFIYQIDTKSSILEKYNRINV